ncbi:MAG: hypothetical protein AAGI37_13360 [Planctomycetota bacterium]
MPVYLFTYHAYGTWWPDRPQGFVQEGKGVQPTNPSLATAYRTAAKHEPVIFTHVMQRALIEKIHHIAETEALLVYGISADPTHLHVLVGWDDGRNYNKVRGRIKNLLSLQLSRLAGMTGRPWFVKESSRKRVKDEDHFEYLLTTYLPKHLGWQWCQRRGWVEPPSCDGGC